MKITTDRGTLFTTASGKSILRWNKNAPPTEENFDQLQKFIDNTVVRHMDAYVPMRTGILKKSVILGSRMGSGELVFIAPYAHKRYYSKNGKLVGKRGSRWFHRMWAALKDTIVREVKNYARTSAGCPAPMCSWRCLPMCWTISSGRQASARTA